jgi:His-Xaa-Ser system radical SAM maturase HxsC
MGIVSRRQPRWLAHRDTIFLVESRNDARRLFSRLAPHRRVVGCILSEDIEIEPPKYVQLVVKLSSDQFSLLSERDVVLMEPSGKITVLYEVNSDHNCLGMTNRCNCKCVMCPQPPHGDAEPATGLNLKLIELMDREQTRHLGITGGEPTLLEDDLLQIITRCLALLPKAHLTLLTNGRKLADMDFAKKLVGAGYPRLTVEVPLYADNDSDHDSIMGPQGSFYQTLTGLHNLALLDQPVGLRTVLHRMTVERLSQYGEFIYRNLPFVCHVAFMGMETTGMAKENIDQLWIDPFDYRFQLAATVKQLARRAVPVSIYNHQLCVLTRDMWPFAKRSISPWKESYLPGCTQCAVRVACGGLFATGERYSAFIQPVVQS